MPPRPRDAGRARQLPAGRHGLPRSFVVSNQRERILDAVADVVSETGYARMRVEDVCVSAGVSRRTFYDFFKNRDDAFLAAYDEAAAQLDASVADAIAGARDFADGVVRGLGAFLEFVASEPRFAHMCIVEVLAAGSEAVERRNAAMRRFAERIQAGAETLEGARQPPAITAETLVGGIYEVVHARVREGDVASLPALLPDLAFTVMLPYLGQEAAARSAGV